MTEHIQFFGSFRKTHFVQNLLILVFVDFSIPGLKNTLKFFRLLSFKLECRNCSAVVRVEAIYDHIVILDRLTFRLDILEPHEVTVIKRMVAPIHQRVLSHLLHSVVPKVRPETCQLTFYIQELQHRLLNWEFRRRCGILSGLTTLLIQRRSATSPVCFQFA